MAVNNSLVAKSKAQQNLGITEYLTKDAIKNQINKVVGGKNGQRFISAIVSAYNTNPTLQECTNQSILSAALLGESLQLSPSPQLGHYYMVPFNNTKAGTKEAQFQMGYKGYIQLAIRSGQYKRLNVVAIKEGELEYFDPLNEDIKVNLMVDDWDKREKAETIGYYAMFELVNGFKKTMYWSKAQMLAHADKYSQAFYKDAGKVKTMTNGDYIRSLSNTDLSMIVMCPNEIGFNEVECHKDDKFCQECTLNWLMAEREVEVDENI